MFAVSNYVILCTFAGVKHALSQICYNFTNSKDLPHAAAEIASLRLQAHN